jgi:hypothetical protein
MAFVGQLAPEQDRSFVQFYRTARQNEYESEKQGRPVFDEFDYIRIRAPGMDKQVVDRKVKPEDKVRWRQQWENYERGLEQAATGTPLAEWPNLSVSDVARLQSWNIHTVEALAELADDGVQRVGPGTMELRKRAQYWLSEALPRSEAANSKAKNDELRAENERLAFELARALNDLEEGTQSLTQENEALKSELAKLKAYTRSLEESLTEESEKTKRAKK